MAISKWFLTRTDKGFFTAVARTTGNHSPLPRGFKQRTRPLGDPPGAGAGLVAPEGLVFACQRVSPLLDEGLGHRGPLVDGPVQPRRGVDAGRETLAGPAAAGHADVETPEPL